MGSYEEYGQRPWYEFSSFPTEGERSAIFKASAHELAERITSHPEKSGRFFHELWRTGRVAMIHAAVREIPEAKHEAMVAALPLDITNAASTMRAKYGASPKDAEDYVRTVFTAVAKAMAGVDLESNPGEKAKRHIEEFVSNITAYVEKVALPSYKAKMN